MWELILAHPFFRAKLVVPVHTASPFCYLEDRSGAFRPPALGWPPPLAQPRQHPQIMHQHRPGHGQSRCRSLCSASVHPGSILHNADAGLRLRPAPLHALEFPGTVPLTEPRGERGQTAEDLLFRPGRSVELAIEPPSPASALALARRLAACRPPCPAIRRRRPSHSRGTTPKSRQPLGISARKRVANSTSAPLFAPIT